MAESTLQLRARLQGTLHPHSAILALAGGTLCALLIFAVDLVLPDEIRLHALYVLPLAIVARYCSRLWWALGFLLLTTVLQVTAFSLQTVTTPSLISDVGVPFATSLLTLFLARAWRASYLSIARQAALDALTGLANRRAFVATLDAEIARQRRHPDGFALALLDLDGFKALNDSHGHRAGDEALRVVAEVLRSNTRASDGLGRIGGDEFAILMPATATAPMAMLNELCLRVASATVAAGAPVTVSIGCQTFTLPPASSADALQAADRIMYAAKLRGKNRAEHRAELPQPRPGPLGLSTR
jgi:diguanylate cyclase (GGDEF)-like protein